MATAAEALGSFVPPRATAGHRNLLILNKLRATSGRHQSVVQSIIFCVQFVEYEREQKCQSNHVIPSKKTVKTGLNKRAPDTGKTKVVRANVTRNSLCPHKFRKPHRQARSSCQIPPRHGTGWRLHNILTARLLTICGGVFLQR